MAEDFFDNPKTAIIAHPLQGFWRGVSAPFRAILDNYSLANHALIAVSGAGALFGCVLGGIVGCGLVYTALGATSLGAVAGIFGGIVLGVAGGLIAGGAAVGALYLSVAGVLGVGYGLARAGIGLCTGAAQTIGYHLEAREPKRLPAPAFHTAPRSAFPPLIPGRVESTFKDIIDLPAPERERLLKKLSVAFTPAADTAKTESAVVVPASGKKPAPQKADLRI